MLVDFVERKLQGFRKRKILPTKVVPDLQVLTEAYRMFKREPHIQAAVAAEKARLGSIPVPADLELLRCANTLPTTPRRLGTPQSLTSPSKRVAGSGAAFCGGHGPGFGAGPPPPALAACAARAPGDWRVPRGLISRQHQRDGLTVCPC